MRIVDRAKARPYLKDTLKPCHVIPVIRRDRSDMVKTPTKSLLRISFVIRMLVCSIVQKLRRFLPRRMTGIAAYFLSSYSPSWRIPAESGRYAF